MNKDSKTVDGFGDEWSRFDQSELSDDERSELFDLYFSIFPWDKLDSDSIGFDMGCGSGRWAKLVAPKVKTLYCIDPSDAINIAKLNLLANKNCIFLNEEVSNNSLEDCSMDFGYSLGVLHHIPNTSKGISDCVKKLKVGAPFLLYLYYKFDDKGKLFKFIWNVSNFLRIIISKLPFPLRYFVSQIIALIVYLPLARSSLILERIGFSKRLLEKIPLSFYRDKSFYTMRTDSLDRFGTRLEKRFTKDAILEMMSDAGLQNINFSKNQPHWVAVGYKK